MGGMKDKERWHKLCEEIAVEQDPTRFVSLITELNALLDEKITRINKRSSPKEVPSS